MQQGMFPPGGVDHLYRQKPGKSHLENHWRGIGVKGVKEIPPMALDSEDVVRAAHAYLRKAFGIPPFNNAAQERMSLERRGQATV